MARPAQRGRLILASASPRRHRILREAGLDFEVEVSGADEVAPAGIEPEDVARELARRKARAVAGRHAGERAWVLGADTVVALGRRLLGKPRGARAARRMLELLSGSRHLVATGVCLVDCASGSEECACERTWVSMRALCPREVEAYVAGGEWRDKAGGYAIQESAEAFVTALEGGGVDNVVGLPLALARALLERAGALEPER